MNKQVIKLKINSQEDRENLIVALANSGYKVWTEEERDCIHFTIYVLFEIEPKA